MTVILSGTTPYITLRVCSQALAALPIVTHWVGGCVNVRCASVQTLTQLVASMINHMLLTGTHAIAVYFSCWCFLWSDLGVDSAASVCAVSICSPRQLSHSMTDAAYYSSCVTTWLSLLPVATQPQSFIIVSSLAEIYSSTDCISPEGYIAKWIADADEPYRTPTSTGYLVMALFPIIISTILSERIHSVHHTISPSIAIGFSLMTSGRCAMLLNAVSPSMSGMQARFQFVYAVCTLLYD